MTIRDIFAKCIKEGVELSVNNENLDIAYDDYPSEELIDLLKNNKTKVIEYISERKKKSVAQRPKLERLEQQDDQVYTSFPQDMLWFMSELGGLPARYNMSYALKVEGDFNLCLAEQIFKHIIERHQPLRTNYETDAQGNVSAFINPVIDFKIEIVEQEQANTGRASEIIEDFKQSFLSRPFAIKNELLLRVAYVKIDDSKGLLLINIHHIASDGWSLDVLIKEFKQLYEANDFENQLAPLPYSYSDYAYWQRHCLTNFHEEQLEYWGETLLNIPTLHSLPTDKHRPSVQEFVGDKFTVLLSEEKLQQLLDLAAENNSTLFMVFHAVFALLLSKYSNTKDIVIGTLLANRVDKNLETLIGFFSNTVVLRTQIDSKWSFNEFLSHVKKINLAAQDNQDVPFEKVVEKVNPARSRSHTPLCQIMMAFDNTPKSEFGLNGVDFSDDFIEEPYALFDLFLKIYKRKKRLSLCFNYCTALFEESSIIQMADSLTNLIDNLLHSPDATLEELSCLPASFSKQLIPVSKGEYVAIDDTSQVQALFERQVIATPNKVALRFGSKELTYNELNVQSNQVAHLLRRQGVSSQSVVALCSERSLEMVIGIFGILKSGASYLPLEPSYPEDRLCYMLENSVCKTILLPTFVDTRECFEHLDIIRFSAADRCKSDLENPELTSQQNKESLAYVIYTSGSTGLPKGVMISHESLLNRIHWMQNTYKLTHADTVLQKTPFSFDVSVWEFIWPLSYGASLDVLPPEMHKDPNYLVDFIKRREISILHFVPSMFRNLLDECEKGWSQCDALKHVFSSGEPLRLDLVTKHQSLNNAKLHNLYGPTEASIDVSYHSCEVGISGDVPIGVAIQNTQLYILDNNEMALPKGALGELYISGAGLAKGYINNSVLTNDKFVYKHEGNGVAKRFYKTGDLVRSNARGQIFYLGRLDNQVKIRGFRVELGEIEHSLLRLPEVKASVVTCQKNRSGSPVIIAYVVYDMEILDDSSTEHIVNKLSIALQKTLPSYMLPTAYIPISEIPISANGKLDSNALPLWDLILEKKKKVEPSSEIEVNLATIWAEILSLDTQILSINKSFFSFGGNSLSLVRLKSQIEKEFSVDIPTAKLFDTDTIASQAELVEVFLLTQTLKESDAEAFVEEI
jgi:amino acid adenylation domain-containing protein